MIVTELQQGQRNVFVDNFSRRVSVLDFIKDKQDCCQFELFLCTRQERMLDIKK